MIDLSINISKEQLKKIRRKIDPDLLEELTLGEQLKTLREITDQTNAGLAEMLGEGKRTFESWVSGRYVPEGDKLKKVNTILMTAAAQYVIGLLQSKKHPTNAYRDFPYLFRLLAFGDAVALLISIFHERNKTIDYETGKIS